MLSHDLQQDDGILVLKPDGPLTAADFTTLAGHVDAYLEKHGMLHGVMIRAKSFPGWSDFGALIAHLKFVKGHHQRVEKVALVADGAFVSVMPRIAGHFIQAQVRHFDPAHEDAAWTWLRARGSAQGHQAA